MSSPQQTCQNIPTGTCTCSICEKHHCPDCDQSFSDRSNYILHFERLSHKKHPCGYCHLHFLHRSALIQHYESGSCRSLLDRPTIRTMVQQADKARLITNPVRLSIEPPPRLVTQQSWNEYTKRYKCYLCNPAKLGFETLEAINAHIASPKHEAKSYKCPHPLCHRPFNTIGGLVQHIESRACRCLVNSNWWSTYLGIPDTQKPGRMILESAGRLGVEERKLEEERVTIYVEMTGDGGRWDYTGDSFMTRAGSRVLGVVGLFRLLVGRLLWLVLKLVLLGVVLTFSVRIVANMFGFVRAMMVRDINDGTFVQAQ